MSKICVNCVHWEGDEFVQLKPVDRFGVCKRLHDRVDVSGVQPEHFRSVTTFEPYGDFGCNLFEWKPEIPTCGGCGAKIPQWKTHSYTCPAGGYAHCFPNDAAKEEVKTVVKYTPCNHHCIKCIQVNCMCAGGDGRYKRCSRGCNSYGKTI